MLLFVLIPLGWLSISLVVVAICRIAAREDALTAQAKRPARARRPAYSPRRPSTCGTVRSKILTSVHNDQLAT